MREKVDGKTAEVDPVKDTDGNIVGGVGSVTGVTGDFYTSYKREMFQLLSFVEASGVESQKTNKLPDVDQLVLTSKLHAVREKGNDLSRLLSLVFNESNPSFREECTIEAVWTLLEAVFATGQYVGMTSRSFQKYERREQTAPSRKAKSIKDSGRKERRLVVLTRYIQDHPVGAYTKFIQSNLDALNEAAGDDDKAEKSTWIELMQDLGYGTQRKSKTDRVGRKVQD